jgi:hypothetical protein
MKFLLSSAVAACALLTAAASAEETAQFDLWIATGAAQNVIAVSGEAEGAPFVVASGAEKTALDLLAGDDAALALADLKAKAETAPETMTTVEIDTTVEKKSKKNKKAKTTETEIEAETAEVHKIVLVKKAAAEGDTEAKEERRIIKIKTDAGADGESIETVIAEAKAEMAAEGDTGDAIIEKEITISEGEDASLIALAGDEGGKVMILETDDNGATTRLIHVSGASPDSARQFIDEAEGLDDAEKTDMKSNLGL